MDIKFTMHDNREFIVFIENYTADDVKNELNSRGEEFISFGETGFVKHAVKYFEPLSNKEVIQ